MKQKMLLLNSLFINFWSIFIIIFFDEHKKVSEFNEKLQWLNAGSISNEYYRLSDGHKRAVIKALFNLVNTFLFNFFGYKSHFIPSLHLIAFGSYDKLRWMVVKATHLSAAIYGTNTSKLYQLPIWRKRLQTWSIDRNKLFFTILMNGIWGDLKTNCMGASFILLFFSFPSWPDGRLTVASCHTDQESTILFKKLSVEKKILSTWIWWLLLFRKNRKMTIPSGGVIYKCYFG